MLRRKGRPWGQHANRAAFAKARDELASLVEAATSVAGRDLNIELVSMDQLGEGEEADASLSLEQQERTAREDALSARRERARTHPVVIATQTELGAEIAEIRFREPRGDE